MSPLLLSTALFYGELRRILSGDIETNIAFVHIDDA